MCVPHFWDSVCRQTQSIFQVSQGSAETDLRWEENFNKFLFRNSSLNIRVKNYEIRSTFARVITKINVSRFFMGHSVVTFVVSRTVCETRRLIGRKSPIRTHPTLIQRRCSWWPPSNFGMNLISLKTRIIGLPYGKEIVIASRTMWTQCTSVSDRETDGRTDRITMTKTAAILC